MIGMDTVRQMLSDAYEHANQHWPWVGFVIRDVRNTPLPRVTWEISITQILALAVLAGVGWQRLNSVEQTVASAVALNTAAAAAREAGRERREQLEKRMVKMETEHAQLIKEQQEQNNAIKEGMIEHQKFVNQVLRHEFDDYKKFNARGK
jgi:hypothetical protein